MVLILLFVGGLIYKSENLNISMEKWEIDTFLEASRLWIKCDGGLSRVCRSTLPLRLHTTRLMSV